MITVNAAVRSCWLVELAVSTSARMCLKSNNHIVKDSSASGQ